MPGFDHGVQRGLDAVVGALIFGVVSGALVPTLVDAGLLPPGLFTGFVVLSIFSTVMTVDASRYWSFAYLGGFVVGVFFALPLLSQTQFIGPMDWILYGGTAVGAVALRVKIHSSSF
jgi:FtsH-binding integral membrane protein